MQRLEREEETKRWKCQREGEGKVEEEKERATRKSRRKKIVEVVEEKEEVDVIGITEMSNCVEEGASTDKNEDKKVAEEDTSWLQVSEQLSDLELEEDDDDFLLSVVGEVLTVDNTIEELNTEQTLSCSPRGRPPRPSCPPRPHGARASQSNCSGAHKDWLAENLSGFDVLFETFVFFCCECLFHHFSSDQGCLTEIRIDAEVKKVSPSQYLGRIQPGLCLWDVRMLKFDSWTLMQKYHLLDFVHEIMFFLFVT